MDEKTAFEVAATCIKETNKCMVGVGTAMEALAVQANALRKQKRINNNLVLFAMATAVGFIALGAEVIEQRTKIKQLEMRANKQYKDICEKIGAKESNECNA